MNDRFKFRAWDGLEMHYDDFVVTATGYIGKITDEVGFICAINKSDLKADQDLELMQCTGLKDKNNKLIYEGDILRYPPKDKDEEKRYVACEVFFHNNDCCDKHIGFQMNRFRFQGALCGIMNYGTIYNFIPKNTEKMLIIGNIYENPNLLKERNNEKRKN